jgi:hypothetical protein
MQGARGKVIRPEAFRDFVNEEELQDLGEEEELLSPPQQQQQQQLAPAPAPAPGPDYGLAIAKGAQAALGFLNEHRTSIRNTVLIVGGAYVAVKGPPILAKSFAETAHFLREGWHGRGYEDRWLAETNGKKNG